jgi:transcriptional regulator with XRE-family HTH domain
MTRHRKPAEKDRDRKLIAEYYLMGWLQAEIAQAVGLAQSTVSKELRTIREFWRESTLVDVDALLAKEVARIDLIELEYWQAWEASKTLIQPRQVYDQGTGEWTTEIVEIPDARPGDPRFLEGVRRCVRDRIEFLELGPPERLEITTTQAIKVIGGIDLDEDV